MPWYSTPPPAPITNTASRELAERMLERMLRRRLDERLIAASSLVKVDPPPRNAQLSRLRNIIHDELMSTSPSPQRIGDFLNDIKQRPTARKQFERARVGHSHLLHWLHQTYQKTSESEWKALLGFQSEDRHKLGNVQAEITDTLRAEYILRFIDSVLARAAKERKRRGEN